MIKSITLVFISMFFQTAQSFAQSTKDSIDFRIATLNWESFELTPTYFPRLVLSKDARKIVEHIIDSTIIFDKLIKALDNDEKTVTSHIILSKVFKPVGNIFTWSYVYSEKKIVKTNYTYNNLSWQYDSTYKITRIQKEKIKQYWVSMFQTYLEKKGKNAL